MQSNGLHRSCNKTARKFFDDFDLLPAEYKELLWNSPRMPTFEDLKAAWDLARDNFNLNDLLKLHCFEEERKRKEKEDAEKKREAARKAKNDAYWKRKQRPGYVQVYRRELVDRTDKHANLVRVVMSEQEALKALAMRKEAKDIQPAGPVYVNRFVGWKKIDSTDSVEETKYAQFEPQQHMCKAFHNG